MADLIERHLLMKDMYHRAFETDNDTMWQSGCWVRYRAIEEVIKKQPSTDAVDVVRCKDCINYTRGKDEWGSCFENPMKLWRETDYCSWAERRPDATFK